MFEKNDEQEVGFDYLTEGRIVHFTLDDGPRKGRHRPAMVVDVFRDEEGYPTGVVQLQVFADGSPEGRHNDMMPAVFWRTSIRYDDTNRQEGTWHWPEPASWSIKKKEKEE